MRLASALTAALFATSAVWTSMMGDIVYAAEENGAAIFTFTNLDAYPARLVIPGLAGNYSNRGTHEAFWLGGGSGTCPAFMAIAGDDYSTTDWGRAVIAFDKPAFPTSITVTIGWCFEELRERFRGETTAE